MGLLLLAGRDVDRTSTEGRLKPCQRYRRWLCSQMPYSDGPLVTLENAPAMAGMQEQFMM